MVAQFAFGDPELRRAVDSHIAAISELLLEHAVQLPLQKYELYGAEAWPP